jgi:hypothetical protein
MMSKCGLASDDDDRIDYSYGHLRDVWYYLYNKDTPGNVNKVTSFCVVILAKEFNPEKYQHIAEIFSEDYLSSSGSPIPLVTHYLSLYTNGEVKNPPPSCKEYNEKSYDIRRAYIAKPLRDVVTTFGIESILLYNALLLKKKVAVYAPLLQDVLDVCRTLPQLVWHRQNWNIVYPNMSLEENEIETLKSSYIAGFIDPAIENREDLYDIFVNVPAGTITVNPASKDSFGMTKLHKDIAVNLIENVNNPECSDQAVVKELSTKTKELINNLSKLAGEDGKVTLEILHARKMTPATENFLFYLATVEGLTQL